MKGVGSVQYIDTLIITVNGISSVLIEKILWVLITHAFRQEYSNACDTSQPDFVNSRVRPPDLGQQVHVSQKLVFVGVDAGILGNKPVAFEWVCFCAFVWQSWVPRRYGSGVVQRDIRKFEVGALVGDRRADCSTGN